MASPRSVQVSALPPELTPKSLQIIAEHCGDSTALAIWRCYGGGHICVPSAVTADHHLARNLGLDAANAFCAQFASDVMSIPRGKKALDAVRNACIKAQRQQGWSMFDLAREHNLTERQILTICKGVAVVHKLQLDLFKIYP